MALQVWLPLNGNLNNQGLASEVTVSTAPSYIDSGKIGKALSTGGFYLSVEQTNKILNNNYFSICFWIYVNAASGTSHYNPVFGNDSMTAPNNRRYTVFHYPTVNQIHLSWQNYDSGDAKVTYVSTTELLPSYQWTHIAITYNNIKQEINMYKNGSLYHTISNAYQFTNPNYSYQTNLIYNDSTRYINDYRIYDHCLSPKEVKEISKGLVLHYKLDDPYVEATTNYIPQSTDFNSWGSYGFGSHGTKQICYGATPNGTGVYCAVGCDSSSPVLAEMATSYNAPALSNGQKASFSCYVRAGKNEVGKSGFLHIYNTTGSYTQSDTVVSFVFTEEWQRVGGQFVWRSESDSGTYYHCYVVGESMTTAESYDFCEPQFEMKDHATPYTPSKRGIQTQYDKNIYTEPDGTHWVRIAHHNNPAGGVFPSSSASWSSGVYVDDNRWFDVYGTVQQLANFEFMVKQKTTSSASETKYRWIQKKSPLTAVWGDVKASEVTRNTSSGYTDGGYGGLYILNSNTHLCIANATNGNWYGAFGCWTAYSGGIPGYPNTGVTSGYMDLYVKVDEILPLIYDCSGYGYNGLPIGNLTASLDTSRYGMCYNVSNGNAVTTSSLPFAALTNCTISAWIYVQTNGTSGWLPFGGQDNYYYLLATSGGTGTFYHGNAGSNTKIIYRDGVVGTTPLAIGAWHHYCISGVDLSTWTKFGIDDYDSRYGTNWNFTGKVSDVRIYNTVLSADDVKELYDTSAIIYNDGTVAAREAIETNNDNIDITKTGQVATKYFIECDDYLYLPAGTYVDTGLYYNNGDTCKAVTIIRYASGGSGRDLMGFSPSAGGYWGVTSGGAWEPHGSFYYTNSDITKLNNITYEYTALTSVAGDNGNYRVGCLGSAGYTVRNKYIYNVKLYRNGVLERDLYPAFSGSTCGLADALHGVFYLVNGSGATLGNDEEPTARFYKDHIQLNQIIEI